MNLLKIINVNWADEIDFKFIYLTTTTREEKLKELFAEMDELHPNFSTHMYFGTNEDKVVESFSELLEGRTFPISEQTAAELEEIFRQAFMYFNPVLDAIDEALYWLGENDQESATKLAEILNAP